MEPFFLNKFTKTFHCSVIRIKNYLEKGDQVLQGSEMGFIKFGSRVDLFLPLNTKIEVKIGDKVKGNVTVIGRLG